MISTVIANKTFNKTDDPKHIISMNRFAKHVVVLLGVTINYIQKDLTEFRKRNLNYEKSNLELLVMIL